VGDNIRGLKYTFKLENSMKASSPLFALVFLLFLPAFHLKHKVRKETKTKRQRQRDKETKRQRDRPKVGTISINS